MLQKILTVVMKQYPTDLRGSFAVAPGNKNIVKKETAKKTATIIQLIVLNSLVKLLLPNMLLGLRITTI